jgi:hypothetical protein
MEYAKRHYFAGRVWCLRHDAIIKIFLFEIVYYV